MKNHYNLKKKPRSSRHTKRSSRHTKRSLRHKPRSHVLHIKRSYVSKHMYTGVIDKIKTRTHPKFSAVTIAKVNEFASILEEIHNMSVEISVTDPVLDEEITESFKDLDFPNKMRISNLQNIDRHIKEALDFKEYFTRKIEQKNPIKPVDIPTEITRYKEEIKTKTVLDSQLDDDPGDNDNGIEENTADVENIFNQLTEEPPAGSVTEVQEYTEDKVSYRVKKGNKELLDELNTIVTTRPKRAASLIADNRIRNILTKSRPERGTSANKKPKIQSVSVSPPPPKASAAGGYKHQVAASAAGGDAEEKQSVVFGNCPVETRNRNFFESIKRDPDQLKELRTFIVGLGKKSDISKTIIDNILKHPEVIILFFDLPEELDLNIKEFNTPLNDLREGVMDILLKNPDTLIKFREHKVYGDAWTHLITNVKKLRVNIVKTKIEDGTEKDFNYTKRVGGVSNTYDFLCKVRGTNLKLEYKYGLARCIAELPQALQITTQSSNARSLFYGLGVSDITNEELIELAESQPPCRYDEYYWDKCIDAYISTDEELTKCKKLLGKDDAEQRTKYLALVCNRDSKTHPFFDALRARRNEFRKEKLTVITQSYDSYFKYMTPFFNIEGLVNVIQKTQESKVFIFCRNGDFFVEAFNFIADNIDKVEYKSEIRRFIISCKNGGPTFIIYLCWKNTNGILVPAIKLNMGKNDEFDDDEED